MCRWFLLVQGIGYLVPVVTEESDWILRKNETTENKRQRSWFFDGPGLRNGRLGPLRGEAEDGEGDESEDDSEVSSDDSLASDSEVWGGVWVWPSVVPWCGSATWWLVVATLLLLKKINWVSLLYDPGVISYYSYKVTLMCRASEFDQRHTWGITVGVSHQKKRTIRIG